MSALVFLLNLGPFNSFPMCFNIIWTCKAAMKNRLSAGLWLWRNSLSGKESHNKSSAISAETWEPWWTPEWCDQRQQASKVKFVRLHFDRQQLSLPKLQQGLFTLRSPFDTREDESQRLNLYLCQTLHAGFPVLTASNWILMCSWRPPPSFCPL